MGTLSSAEITSFSTEQFWSERIDGDQVLQRNADALFLTPARQQMTP